MWRSAESFDCMQRNVSATLSSCFQPYSFYQSFVSSGFCDTTILFILLGAAFSVIVRFDLVLDSVAFSREHTTLYHIHSLIRLIPTRPYRAPTSDLSDLNDPTCLIATTILLCRTRSVLEGAPDLVKDLLKGHHHSVGRFLTGMIHIRETLAWIVG